MRLVQSSQLFLCLQYYNPQPSYCHGSEQFVFHLHLLLLAPQLARPDDIWVRWNSSNQLDIILNVDVDDSCLGDPNRFGFKGLLRHPQGAWILGFFEFFFGSSGILHIEPHAIHQELLLANQLFFTLLTNQLNYQDITCFKDSIHCVNCRYPSCSNS
jgi:hypothetical protein